MTKKIMGTSGNPGWVSRGSLVKIANSLLCNKLQKCNFLQGIRKPPKTEVFRGSQYVNVLELFKNISF
jgi:hypothetical protein